MAFFQSLFLKLGKWLKMFGKIKLSVRAVMIENKSTHSDKVVLKVQLLFGIIAFICF